MRFFSAAIITFFILYLTDAVFAGGKYARSVTAMGRSIAMSFGFG